jgi:hypothetical protein
MKVLIALLAVAGLAGCVAYPAGYSSVGVTYGTVYDTRGVPYGHDGYRHAPYAGRDRDGDGVPNRYDRDRDGDGVPNRRDARPNDPRRY